MKILEDTGFCTSCRNMVEYSYGDENFSFITKDLKNYKNYKDLYVYKCQCCGFISTDIACEEGVIYGDVKNSLEYREALNYEYLGGLDLDLYDQHSQSVPANLYEAYSFVCLKAENYEKFIRSLNKAIELKEVMARQYRRSQDELGGEEENDEDYEKLDGLIKQSIQDNAKQIDFYYSQLDHKNLFVTLIYIENLTRLNQFELAQKLFDEICNKILIKDDLKTYIQEKIYQ
ncbi:MAG: hypothetical protein E7378_01250 [Clostridiales bacterium]|nr:hypothetical protein [Clostridiales bacterium]